MLAVKASQLCMQIMQFQYLINFCCWAVVVQVSTEKIIG